MHNSVIKMINQKPRIDPTEMTARSANMALLVQLKLISTTSD